ncbi:MAG: MATE family efflux transporter [Pseudomonadota bacterium]|nr:MATE family efflux transporter [Pseudomonadota bacterium]
MLPILLTQVAQAGYGLIDTIMAGRVSPADLAAIAIGAGLWLPIFLLISGILMATTPLVAEAIGAKQRQRAPLITHQAIWVGLLLGVMGFFLLRLSPMLFEPLGVPSNLQAMTTTYLTGVSYGVPAMAVYTALRCYTEALGHPRVVTVISLLGLGLNIPLNYVFIYGYGMIPAMGGAGCGYATAILIWMMLLALMSYISWASTYAVVRVFQQFKRPVWRGMRPILALGIPIGVSIFFEVSLFSMAALILSPLGEVVVAAHQIALSVTSQLFMIPLALAMALTIRIGQLYGEKNWDTLKLVRHLGLLTATTLALCTMTLIALFREQMAMAYTADTQVQTLAIHLLLFALAYQLVDAWQVSAAGILRGLQDTQVPMWITLFCYWLVALPLGVWLSRGLEYGAAGFWFGLVLGLGLAAGLLGWRLRWIQQRFDHSPKT